MTWPNGLDLLLTSIDDGELPEATKLLGAADEKGIVRWLKKNEGATNALQQLLEAGIPDSVADLSKKQVQALAGVAENLKDYTLARLAGVFAEPDSQLGPDEALEVFRELAARATLSKKSQKYLDRLAKGTTKGSTRDAKLGLLANAFVAHAWSTSGLLEEDQDLFRRVLTADRSGRLALMVARELDATPRALHLAQKDAIAKGILRLEDKRDWRQVTELLLTYAPWME